MKRLLFLFSLIFSLQFLTEYGAEFKEAKEIKEKAAEVKESKKLEELKYNASKFIKSSGIIALFHILEMLAKNYRLIDKIKLPRDSFISVKEIKVARDSSIFDCIYKKGNHYKLMADMKKFKEHSVFAEYLPSKKAFADRKKELREEVDTVLKSMIASCEILNADEKKSVDELESLIIRKFPFEVFVKNFNEKAQKPNFVYYLNFIGSVLKDLLAYFRSLTQTYGQYKISLSIDPYGNDIVTEKKFNEFIPAWSWYYNYFKPLNEIQKRIIKQIINRLSKNEIQIEEARNYLSLTNYQKILDEQLNGMPKTYNLKTKDYEPNLKSAYETIEFMSLINRAEKEHLYINFNKM